MSSRTTLANTVIVIIVALLVITGCSRNANPDSATEQGPAAQQEAVVEQPTNTPIPEPTPEPTVEPTVEPTAEATEEPAESEADAQAAAESTSDEPAQPDSPLASGQPTSPLSAPPQSESPLPLPTITAADAEVLPDLSYVSGILMSNIDGQPLANSVIRFPKVFCPVESEDAAESAPSEGREMGNGCFWTLSDAFTQGTVTDEQGFFAVKDMLPGDYIILVGDMMTVYAFALVDAENPFQFNAPINNAIDLGQVFVEYQ